MTTIVVNGTVAAVGLAERIDWIIKTRDMKSQRELARRAGLKETHVGMIVARHRGTEEVATEGDTLAAIARAGEVSIDWLVTGEGEPSPPAHRVQRERRYPNRERVIERHKYVWPLALVEALRSVKLEADTDRSERAWLEEAEAVWARLRGKAAAPLVDLSEGPAPDMSFLVRGKKKPPPRAAAGKARRREKPLADRKGG